MSEPGRKMSLTQATMLVAGNMIGTGLFLLPVESCAGRWHRQRLDGALRPSGVAAHWTRFRETRRAQSAEGRSVRLRARFPSDRYTEFQTNYVYWFGDWIGNIAIAVGAVGYPAPNCPRITEPPASVFATAAVIWLLTFANILGPRIVGTPGVWTMALALIPINRRSRCWAGSGSTPGISLGGWNVTRRVEYACHLARRLDGPCGLTWVSRVRPSRPA